MREVHSRTGIRSKLGLLGRMGAILSVFVRHAISARLLRAKIWPERGSAFVAILRAIKVLGFAPFTANHLFGDPDRGKKADLITEANQNRLNAKYSNAKLAMRQRHFHFHRAYLGSPVPR